MTKQHIDRLKELLVATMDLTEPLDYFLQQAITDAEIVRASQPAASALLLHVMLELVERHCEQELFVLAPVFLHAATYRLWHGGCHLGGYVTRNARQRQLDPPREGIYARLESSRPLFLLGSTRVALGCPTPGFPGTYLRTYAWNARGAEKRSEPNRSNRHCSSKRTVEPLQRLSLTNSMRRR